MDIGTMVFVLCGTGVEEDVSEFSLGPAVQVTGWKGVGVGWERTKESGIEDGVA
jgi:hypothetical protein